MRCIRRSQIAVRLVARGKSLPRRIPLFVFYFSLLISISACSLGADKNPIQHATAPPPSTGKDKPKDTLAAMPTAMDTFRALAPPEGLHFTPLFNDKLTDVNARLDRLENAVQSLRNDLDTVAPAMVRFVAIEKDIKGLVAQLQTLTDQGQNTAASSAPAVPAQPVTPVTPQKLPPQKTTSGGKKIPGEDVTGGTEPAAAADKAGPNVPSSLVTPEAASKGELPPEGAASPNSKQPAATLKPQSAAAAPAAPKPAPKADKLATPPAATTVTPTLSKAATASPQGAALAPLSLAPPAAMNTSSAAAPSQTQPPAEKSPPQAEATEPKLGDVTNFRMADYPDHTRVVLEMTAKSGTARIENNGKTLVIDLTKMNWIGKKSWDADSAQLISGYHVEAGNLYVDLMYASQIKSLEFLSPGSGSANYRLVIDLFSPEVHK